MGQTTDRRALFFYSNPPDTNRLRLDKEHKAIERVLSDLRVDGRRAKRLHATSISDLIRAVKEEQFDIVHFSGHGSEEGIYLESETSEKAVLISVEKIAKALSSCPGSMEAAVFMSCFSANIVTRLIAAAPYLITVQGPADDDAAICFAEAFYRAYFGGQAIEQCFESGLLQIEIDDRGQMLLPVMSRRALDDQHNKRLIQIFPWGRHQSIVVDITEAQPSITALGIDEQEFLYILTRKIRVHRWIFATPKERAIIGIGRYFGLFSWAECADILRCHRVLAIRDDVDEQTCDAWATLIVQYNDLWSESYRSPSRQVADMRLLKMAVARFNDTFELLFGSQRSALLRELCPSDYKTARASIHANMWMAEMKLHQDDAQAVIKYLEIALSSLHDLIDAMTGKVLRTT